MHSRPSRPRAPRSGLLAREALTHPFFGAGRVQHAAVPRSIAGHRWGAGPHAAFTALYQAAPAGKAAAAAAEPAAA